MASSAPVLSELSVCLSVALSVCLSVSVALPLPSGSEVQRPCRSRRYVVTAAMVEEKTKDLLANVDLSKFVL